MISVAEAILLEPQQCMVPFAPQPLLLCVQLQRVFVHPGFDFSSASNDVALLKLQKPVHGVHVANLAGPKLVSVAHF